MTKTSIAKPMFSIITVCLNNKDGLVRTYNSLKMQSCDDYEWIVVDGVSTDGTVDFLKTLPESSNLIWESESDSGLYDAMNKGMASAKGEYLLFLNSGDELSSHEVLQQVKKFILKEKSPAFIYGDSFELCMDGSKVYKRARNHSYLWYGMFTHHQAMFYRKVAVGELNYSSKWPVGADYGFTAGVIKNNESAAYFPDAVCLFEQGGLSEQNIDQGESDQFSIRREVLRYSVFICTLIKALHATVYLIKRTVPWAHKLIRYSKKRDI